MEREDFASDKEKSSFLDRIDDLIVTYTEAYKGTDDDGYRAYMKGLKESRRIFLLCLKGYVDDIDSGFGLNAQQLRKHLKERLKIRFGGDDK